FLVLSVMIIAIRHYKETRRDIYWGSIVAFILISVQVLSGGFVVLSQLSLFATIFHSIVITMLFSVLSYLCLQSIKAPQEQTIRSQTIQSENTKEPHPIY
ncbi:MAG: heme A synthase, partial [Clostridia bacterium]